MFVQKRKPLYFIINTTSYVSSFILGLFLTISEKILNDPSTQLDPVPGNYSIEKPTKYNRIFLNKPLHFEYSLITRN